jgi:hypothetical protein
MKRILLIFFCFLYVSLSMVDSLSSSLMARPYQEHEPIKEEVIVTNVEVPVRVLYKGKPVTDLTRKDFIIYENREKMEINGFFVKRKKIKISTSSGTTKPTGQEVSLPPLPRMFVLAFNVTQYNKYFQEAVDHLFDKILRPTDHVIVFANNTSRQYPRLDNIARIKQQIIDDLRRESKNTKMRLLRFTNRINTFLNSIHPGEDFRNFAEPGGPGATDAAIFLARFLKKFIVEWNEYKAKYLTPRVEQFYYFARYLQKVKGEKYVLNFHQFEFFPQVRVSSRAMLNIRSIANVLSNSNDGGHISQGRQIDRLLSQLIKGYDLEKGFPYEEITRLFSKVDTTFHSFFIRATNPTTRQDLEYRIVASDLEKVLKGITDLTGGKNITSNDLVASLELVAEVEDVYYIITYAPRDPNVTGKLKIKVKDKKYKVFYDNNFRADYINEYLQKLEEKLKTPEIKIEEFSFDRKILAFTVTDYMMKEKDKNTLAQMKIRICLKDKEGHSLFDQEKILTARENETKISLGNFKTIKRGEYDFLISAKDLFTGKEVNFHQKIAVK